MTTDIYLSRYAGRNLLALVIENMDLYVRQGPADAGQFVTIGPRMDDPGCRNHGAFRGSIIVYQTKRQVRRWKDTKRVGPGQHEAQGCLSGPLQREHPLR